MNPTDIHFYTFKDGTTINIKAMADDTLKNLIREHWQKRFEYREAVENKDGNPLDIMSFNVPQWRYLLREATRRGFYLMGWLPNYPDYWKPLGN